MRSVPCNRRGRLAGVAADVVVVSEVTDVDDEDDDDDDVVVVEAPTVFPPFS